MLLDDVVRSVGFRADEKNRRRRLCGREGESATHSYLQRRWPPLPQRGFVANPFRARAHINPWTAVPNTPYAGPSKTQGRAILIHHSPAGSMMNRFRSPPAQIEGPEDGSRGPDRTGLAEARTRMSPSFACGWLSDSGAAGTDLA